jgi:hypothetical protein
MSTDYNLIKEVSKKHSEARKIYNDKYPSTSFNEVNVEVEVNCTTHNAGVTSFNEQPCEFKARWRIFLPHSCDEWVIGDAAQIIQDLQQALSYTQKSTLYNLLP